MSIFEPFLTVFQLLSCFAVWFVSEHSLDDLNQFGTILGNKLFFVVVWLFYLLFNGFKQYWTVIDRFLAFVLFGRISRSWALRRWLQAFLDNFGQQSSKFVLFFCHYVHLWTVVGKFEPFLTFFSVCVVWRYQSFLSFPYVSQSILGRFSATKFFSCLVKYPLLNGFDCFKTVLDIFDCFSVLFSQSLFVRIIPFMSTPWVIWSILGRFLAT